MFDTDLLIIYLFIILVFICSFNIVLIYLFIYRDLSARVRQVQQGCV